MSVPLSERVAAPELAQEEPMGLKRKILDFYQAFPAPFSERKALLMLGDAGLVVGAVFVAYQIWRPAALADLGSANPVGPRWYWFAVLLGGWWGLAWLMDLYDIPSSFDRAACAFRVGLVGVANLAIYLAVFFLVPNDLPRIFFLYLLLIVWPAITLWRWVYAAIFSASSLQHRILIIGHGERARSIANVLEESKRLNYQVIGYYADDEQARREPRHDDLSVWTQAHKLSDLVQQNQIHEVVVAIDQIVDNDLFAQLTKCQARGIRVSLMPDLYEKLCRRVPIEHIDPAWVLQVLQGRPVFSRFQLALKRLMDLALGLAGLLLLTLALPLIALLIRLDSPGPIFYRQVRSGRANKPFRIFKLRTMEVNAEEDGQARWAMKGDPRVTRVGWFLRKSHLDELPQVFNVLSGEMSFVGPRPERPEFVAQLQQVVPYYPIRLMVKPGLTGWAQTQYGYGSSVNDALTKMQYDFYYLRNWSLWLDLYIILRTLATVLRMGGR